MLHIRPPDDKGIKEAFPVVWWDGIQVFEQSFLHIKTRLSNSFTSNTGLLEA